MKEALQNETSTDMIVEGKIINRMKTQFKTKHAKGYFSKISHISPEKTVCKPFQR